MDMQKDEDFEKAWQENRHIWESTKNLAKAMFYAGQAKAQAIPDGFVVVPKELTYEQAVKISDDENFFETYQTILTESDTSEDSAVILIQTAHKAMIEAQEQSHE